MRKPGVVQMAGKISANDIVPIALIYDYLVDSQDIRGMCPAFLSSLAKVQQNGGSLSAEPCFNGECPSRDNLNIICPSGFWGFRHDIGVPTPTPYGPELALTINYTGTPLIDTAAVYTDFAQLPPHLARLDKLPATVQRKSDRGEVVALLKGNQPQLVYFYCHGLLQDTFRRCWWAARPARATSPPTHGAICIRWPQARPLMFINGCHTHGDLARAGAESGEGAGGENRSGGCDRHRDHDLRGAGASLCRGHDSAVSGGNAAGAGHAGSAFTVTGAQQPARAGLHAARLRIAAAGAGRVNAESKDYADDADYA